MNSMMITGQRYTMDPETEDLIYGDKLENGMVVMIEASLVRGSVDSTSKYEQERALTANRWCEVTELRVRPRYGEEGPDPLIKFIGLYADGTKRERTYSGGYCWFVKKDSLPKPADVDETIKNPQSFVGHSFTEAAGYHDVQGSDDRVDYAEGDAEATMTLFPHQRALNITQDQLERLGEAIREIVPEAEFRVEDEVFVLELTVDEVEEEAPTLSKDEYVRAVTDMAERSGIDIAGIKNEEKLPGLLTAELKVSYVGPIEDIQSADGPLARAMRNKGDRLQ